MEELSSRLAQVKPEEIIKLLSKMTNLACFKLKLFFKNEQL